MKTLIIIFLITINFGVYAQKSIFVRVYNLSGKKINSGHVLILTDSSLQLSDEKSNIIPLSSIDYNKTKHSENKNKIIGSILGATTGAILGRESNEIVSMKQVLFGLIGLGIGAEIGGLINSLKKSKTYLINGDLAKWKAFQLMVTGTNVK